MIFCYVLNLPYEFLSEIGHAHFTRKCHVTKYNLRVLKTTIVTFFQATSHKCHVTMWGLEQALGSHIAGNLQECNKNAMAKIQLKIANARGQVLLYTAKCIKTIA